MQEVSGSAPEPIDPTKANLTSAKEIPKFAKEQLELIERKGFELVSSYRISDLNTDVLTLRHKSSQAIVVSVHNDDPIGRFHARVTTLPEDSTGVFHKLEHALLSGSKSVTVAEPFEEMYRSLVVSDTNAGTADDHTEYFCASKDPASLGIMRRIMLDAMLRGTLSEEIFKREHGHLQFVKTQDRSEELVFNGIVHEEMSGYYVASGMWLGNAQKAALMLGTPYAHDAGGDPAEMPTLTYEKFLETYRKFYGTANFTVAMYGNEPLDQRLDFISEQFTETHGVGTRVDLPPAVLTPTQSEVVVPYPAETEDPEILEKSEILEVHWKIPRVTDPQEDLELDLLAFMLSSAEFSPMQKAAYGSGLKNSYTGMSYFPLGNVDVLGFGFVNCQRSDCKQSSVIVVETLTKLVKDGFPPELVEAAINSREYAAKREQASPKRGEAVLAHALEHAWRGEFKGDELTTEEKLSKLREKLLKGEAVFEKLVEKHILNNPNRIDVIHVPDTGLMDDWLAQQEDWIDSQAAALGPEGLERVKAEAKRLSELEDQRRNDNSRAGFPVAQIPESFRTHPRVRLSVSEVEGVTVYRASEQTHGIANLGIELSASGLSKDELQIAQVIGMMLTVCGSKGEAEGSYAAKIGAHTGGVSAKLEFRSEKTATPDAMRWPEVVLRINAEAKPDQFERMLELVTDPLKQPEFNRPEFLGNLIQKSITNLELSRFDPGALRQAVVSKLVEGSTASGSLAAIGSIEQQLSFLYHLKEKVEKDWPGVVSEFESVWQKIGRKEGLSVNVCIDDENWNRFEPMLEQELKSLTPRLKTDVPTNAQELFVPTQISLGIIMPADSNYVGARVTLREADGRPTPNEGKVAVVCSLLERYLNGEVRSKGGAYGSSAFFDPRSGALQFLSWQDPHIARTLDVYKRVPEFLRDEVTEDHLRRDKVMTVNAIDAELPAVIRGLNAIEDHRSKRSIESRDLIRAEVADLTLAEIHSIADQIERAFSEEHTVVVYGSKPALSEAQKLGIISQIEGR